MMSYDRYACQCYCNRTSGVDRGFRGFVHSKREKEGCSLYWMSICRILFPLMYVQSEKACKKMIMQLKRELAAIITGLKGMII